MDKERKQQIEAYVQKNYAKNVSLKELADQLYLSEGYLSRYVRKTFGMTFSEYVKEIRLSHALDDLGHTAHGITQIIYENGFTNPGFFYREFKKKYGMSPAEYRAGIHWNGDEMESDDGQNTDEDGENVSRSEIQVETRENVSQFEIQRETKDYVDAYLTFADSELQSGQSMTETMVNMGSAAGLLDHEMQEHLRMLQESCHFDYVRIWDIFSRELWIDIENKKGEYNFRKLDQVLDVIVELGLFPFLDLDKKEQRINVNVHDQMIYGADMVVFSDLDAWTRLLRAALQHWIERYGEAQVSHWKIEVWYGGYLLQKCSVQESFFQIFAETYRLVRTILPQMQVGGPGIFPGCMSETVENEFLQEWAKRTVLPDFVSMMEYDYVVDTDVDEQYDGQSGERMERSNGFRQKSTSTSLLADRVRRLRRWMHLAGMGEVRICISEWNKTVSDRCSLSDSCYQGAYVLKNLCDVLGKVDLIGYHSGTDMMSEFFDSKALLFGGKGLMTKDGILKPAGVAFQFLKELHLSGGITYRDGVATADGQNGYSILCHNMRPLSPFYYETEEDQVEKEAVWKCFADEKHKKLQICLKSLQSGTYQIRIWRVNEQFGSILDLWRQLDFAQDLSEADMRYLRGCCQPQIVRTHRMAEQDGLHLTLDLAPNEILLVQVKSGKLADDRTC